jgi:hypothetical protein
MRDIGIRKMAEATALDLKCPTLKIAAAQMTTSVMRAGVFVDDALMDEVNVQTKELLVQMKDADEREACDLGWVLYGPKGSNAADSLMPE